MRTIAIAMLACVVSPALADVYRCNSGGKTVYQDEPCPNGKVIDNVNGKAPSPQEQMRAMERAAKDRAFLDRLSKNREAQAQAQSRAQTRRVTTTQTTVSASPVARKPNGPDRYYDRPDRYYDRPDRYYDRPDKYNNRSVSTQRTIQYK